MPPDLNPTIWDGLLILAVTYLLAKASVPRRWYWR